MTHRKLRRVKLATQVMTWLMAIAAIGVLVLGILLRAPVATDVQSPKESQAGSVAPQSTLPAVQSFASIWKRDLRQQLIKPQAEEVEKVEVTPPPPPVSLPKLHATFVEHGRSFGLFAGSRGSIRVRPEGATIDTFEILSISPGSAQLRKRGESYTIRIPAKKSRLPGGNRSGRRG